uniref:Uncharacterized protein n=1 Tax=Elaeophora elaphi TaxID=1147741 RepID=A0A0R3RZK5_9BILA
MHHQCTTIFPGLSFLGVSLPYFTDFNLLLFLRLLQPVSLLEDDIY